MKLIVEINKLRKKKEAVILAHFYQISEIQNIADYVGDSLALAQQAQQTQSKIIVFAGVHFMAETAKILNPKVKVLIPDINAGCSLAESCTEEKFKKFRDKYPDHTVVSYINCSAEIKALSDVICTSGNAIQVVSSFPKNKKIIFTPDKNLGSYINKISGRNMILWNGTCHVHDLLSIEAIINLKIKNPDAKLIAHPECKAQVLELADFIGSTNAMLNFTISDKHKKYIVATESGILYQMKKASPHKEFIIVPIDETCSCNDCPYMKLITLKKIYFCLKNEKPEIVLSEELINKAKKPIIKMLNISKKFNIIK